MAKLLALPRVGLPADELLKMRGRSTDDILVWPSEVTGSDENGLVVLWEYKDCTVELRRKRPYGRFRVHEVREKETA
jgi:hypothetical protein